MISVDIQQTNRWVFNFRVEFLQFLIVFLPVSDNISQTSIVRSEIDSDRNSQFISERKQFRLPAVESRMFTSGTIRRETALDDVTPFKLGAPLLADDVPCHLAQVVCVGTFVTFT